MSEPDDGPVRGADTGLAVVVYGAGGHGRVVAEAAALSGLRVLGFLDDGKAEGPVQGLPLLGGGGWIRLHRDVRVIPAIGDNAAREHVCATMSELGIELASAIHPSAVVSPAARVEAGAAILALAVVNAGAVIGRGAIVNSAAVIEHDVVLGEFAHVSPGAVIAGGGRLGRLGHLGSGACVLPNVEIGEQSIVGAGAVVTRSIPPQRVAYGVPARVVRALS